jgi:ABC-type sugar transport system permease subunit
VNFHISNESTAIPLPSEVVMPLAAAVLLWAEIFHPSRGLANILLESVGLTRVSWLGGETSSLIALLIVTVWSISGLHIVIQLSALSAIPTDLKEAARLETTSTWRVFRHIVLPLLRDGLTVSGVLVVTTTFVFFTSAAFIMTGGGPNHATEILGLRMYREAFTSFQFGSANAVTVIGLITTAAVVGMILALGSRKRVEF